MESLASMATAPLDMSIGKMTGVRDLTWKGKRFKVVCNESKDHPSWWTHLDEFVTRDLWWNIAEGDIVLDIGAEFGSYSLTALAAGASLVVAWSPPFKTATPVEAHVLSLSAWESGFEDRLIIQPSGLWSARGWLAASDGPEPPMFFRSREEALAAVEGKTGCRTVFPVKTLDEFLETVPLTTRERGVRGLWRQPRKWWMKIDAEGSELEILRGAKSFISTMRPNIIVENHPYVLKDAESVVEEFILGLRLGYEKVGTRPHYVVSHSLYIDVEEQGAK